MPYGGGLYGAGPYGHSINRRSWTHRLLERLGFDPVFADAAVQVHTYDGAAWSYDTDLSSALVSYTVTYGRRDANSRCEALTATLVLATARAPVPLPVATRIRVTLSADVCAALGISTDVGVRFTGEVTEPTVDHAAGLTQLACVGRLGRAYRRSVDGITWPVEDDADRIDRILSAVSVDVGAIDPGSVDVAAPTQPETVGSLVEVVEASALGRVIEQPTGAVDYHDAEHRRGLPVAVTLDSADVFRQVTWTQRLASLLNRVDVKIAAGTVHTTTDTESADNARYGLWPGTTDTVLTTPLDAFELGTEIVGRRADPSWSLPDLTVDLTRTVDPDDLPHVLALTHGSLVALTDLPAGFPLPDGQVYVEGYTETATPRRWQMSVSVSDPAYSAAGVRWVDIPDTDAYQWQDIDLDVSWFDTARVYDPADLL